MIGSGRAGRTKRVPSFSVASLVVVLGYRLQKTFFGFGAQQISETVKKVEYSFIRSGLFQYLMIRREPYST
jgi:hypothetical protein